MAFNNTGHTSEIETILVNTEFEREIKKKHDRINDWVDVTVQNEIRRGKRLREAKPVPDNTSYEYNVDEIDFLASFANQCRERNGKSSTKKSKSGSRSNKYLQSTSVPTTSSSVNRVLIKTNSTRIKTKHPKRCSIRTAELAVPTKRQCIDTWRNKSNILPQLMVDRLKQHVMDQRPIVKIPEAIYCFQQRKPRSTKNYIQSKNLNKYGSVKPCRQKHTRTLCILFAHKVAERLSQPLNISLNSDLEKLSRIVSNDIAEIISNYQCAFSKYRLYRAIHTDVSEKITIWIASILEDLSYKLLEEDLRDLEEEEGPVLDFIDDVLDNAMNICLPYKLQIESDTSRCSNDEAIEEESENPATPTTDKELTKLEEIFNTEETDEFQASDEITNADHFRNELLSIIDNVIQYAEDGISNGSGDDIHNEDNEEISPEAELEGDVINNEEAGENDTNEDGNVIQDTDDDKKVNFPVTNLVNSDNLTDTIQQSAPSSLPTSPSPDTGVPDLLPNALKLPSGLLKDHDHEQNQFHQQKSTIMFAEPNIHLLSDADECWPDDLSDRQLFKVSDSASKSVLSLGRITEKEEKPTSPLDEDSLDGSDLQEKSIPPIQKQDTESQSDRQAIISKGTITEDGNDGTKDEKSLIVENVPDDQLSDHSKIAIDEGNIDEVIKSTVITSATKTQSHPDAWKVHLKTAPLWVKFGGQGRGEPSEDSLSIQKRRTQVTEKEIRKWCNELEKAFKNLEIWNHWIYATCKETTYLLKQKELPCQVMAKRSAINWNKLKKNIHKDAFVWTKLYQRTENKFKSLKQKYNKVQIVIDHSAKCTCNKMKR